MNKITYTIKKIKYKKHNYGYQGDMICADITDNIKLYADEEPCYEIKHYTASYCIDEYYNEDHQEFDTIKEAKAWLQNILNEYVEQYLLKVK